MSKPEEQLKIFDVLPDSEQFRLVNAIISRYLNFRLNYQHHMVVLHKKQIDHAVITASKDSLTLEIYECCVFSLVPLRTNIQSLVTNQYCHISKPNDLCDLHLIFGNNTINVENNIIREEEFFQVSTVHDLCEIEYYQNGLNSLLKLCPFGYRLSMIPMEETELVFINEHLELLLGAI